MYNREFFDSKLGQAALASISAMVLLIAVSTQFELAQGAPSTMAFDAAAVEVA